MVFTSLVTSWLLLLGYKVDPYILVLFSFWFIFFNFCHFDPSHLIYEKKKHTWLMDYTTSSKITFFFF